METPREVLFRTMHEHWAINNKDLARAILMENSVTSGKSPQELIEVRSSLSRFVVHVKPDEYTYGWLAPFEQSIPKVMGLVKRSKRPHASRDIVDVLSGAAADDMRASFEAHGMDGALYANVVNRLSREGVASVADTSELITALFVVAGCSGNPTTAAEYAIGLANRLSVASALQTALPEETQSDNQKAPVSLGVYRCEGDVLLSGVYRLATDEAGTEVGALSLTAHSINDVGYGVSRQHARIWRDADGSWWVEGLGSTNGTIHMSGANGKETVVEPPRSGRNDWIAAPVRVQIGDRIVLAGTTEFVFVALPEL